MIQWLRVGTVVISSAGTFGDFLPFIALGAELVRRGHTVRLAVNESVHPFARTLGLDPLPCGRPFGAEQARHVPYVFDHWRQPPNGDWDEHDWERADLPGHFHDLKNAIQGADLLVASSTQGAAPLVHEATGIPWASVFLMPWQVADIAVEAPPFGEKFDLWLERIRQSLDLPPRPLEKRSVHRWSSRKLLAASRHFSGELPELARDFIHTGFIFCEEPEEFLPSDDLAEFVEKPPGPIVLSLSSLVVEDPRQFVSIHLEAARRAGFRLLIQSGWAGFSAADLPAGTLPGDVRIESFVPHRWLFSKARAVVTHGGIGTIARALEAGCPLVVEPFGSDQIFNAGRVKALGAGFALHPHRITVESLAHTFRERVTAGNVRASAQAVGAKLAAENGLAETSDAVEMWLAGTGRAR